MMDYMTIVLDSEIRELKLENEKLKRLFIWNYENECQHSSDPEYKECVDLYNQLETLKKNK